MVRLIPKDEKFYDLFVEDARIMLEAARKLEEMVGVYDRLDERVSEIQALEHEGDGVDNEVEARLERASSRRSIARTSTSSCPHRRRARRHPGDRGDVRDLQRQGADGRRPEAGRDPRGPGPAAARGHRQARALKDIEPHVRQIHELENKADGLSRAAVARLFRDGIDPIEVIKRRDIYTALENTIDAAEDAAEVIERILAKNAGAARGRMAQRRLELAGERHPVGDREHHVVHASSPAIVSLTSRSVCVSWSSTLGSATSPLHRTLSSAIRPPGRTSSTQRS